MGFGGWNNNYKFIWIPFDFYKSSILPSYKKRSSNLDYLFKLLKENRVRKIIDLGSGDGRVVIDFTKAGFDSYGIEINPILVLWSKLKIKKLKLRAHISWGNFWNKNLSEFDAVFIFQFKTANKLLSGKLRRELKPGAIIISTGFSLENFQFLREHGPFLIYKIF